MMPPASGSPSASSLSSCFFDIWSDDFSPSGSAPSFAQRLAPLVQHLVEGAAARLVADEAVLVLDLEIVAVDFDARQALGAVCVENLTVVFCHYAHRSPPRVWRSALFFTGAPSARRPYAGNKTRSRTKAFLVMQETGTSRASAPFSRRRQATRGRNQCRSTTPS